MNKRIIGMLLALLALLLAPPLQASWSLVNEASLITFVSIKKNSVAEVGHFKQVAGTIGDDGKVEMKIDLASVDTGIEVRDQRMRELLFDTGRFPAALINATVDAAILSGMQPGEDTAARFRLELNLHGQKKVLETVAHITALTGKRILVHGISPVIVSAGDFGLAGGIEKLREIAGLPAIATAVPVCFNLVFERD